MDFPDERIIFLVLFVVIGAVKWLLEKIRGTDQAHDVSESLEEMYEDFRDEIRERQTEVQQPAPPPLPQAAVPEPVHVPSTPPASALPEHFQVRHTELSAEEKIALERVQKHGRSGKRRHKVTGSVRDMLSSPASARQAVVLKEILGEPRSMQRI